MVTSNRKSVPYQIAVVDDCPCVLKAVQRMLTAAGYRVRVFESGEDFLAHFGGDDGVVLDVHLPGLSGVELERRMRAIAPELPVVFFSACQDEVQARIMQVTGRVCVRKPDEGGVLLEAIANAIRAGRRGTPTADS
jgi:FixJ family two-component response regulator